MPKFILIDTCVLKELVSPVEFSGYLRQIISWHEKGEITVLCGETLRAEWQKHREIEISKIQQILKKHQQQLKISTLFEQTPDIGDDQLNAADKLLRSQVEAIDDLLSKCRQIKDEGAVAKIMWEHRSKKEAPFHNKAESENDAVILFSALNEVMQMERKELYFLSSNHTDYANPTDKSIIHPDIQTAFPEVNIIYYPKLSEAITGLTQMGLPDGKPVVQHRRAVKALIPVNHSLGIKSQIISYLDKRFQDIRFLPKKLFSIHFPFITAATYDPRERPFTMDTDNQELYDLFAGATKTSDKLLGPDHKALDPDTEMTTILQYLRGNLVHAITFKDGVPLDLPPVSFGHCECDVCLFRRSKFDKLFSKPLDELIAVDPTLKKAYTYYLLGDIQESVVVLKEVKQMAEESHKWLTYYIANYNLTLMVWHLRFGVSPDQRDQQLIDELNQIRLEDVFTVSRTDSLADILEHLKKGKFLEKGLADIRDLVDRIKVHQHDQNTGWTDETRMLMDLYFETMYFAEQNYLMLDNFYQSSRMTEYLTEGLFASYACHKDMGGKLLHFSDAIVEKLVTYGKHDDIKKYRKRYKIKVAKYQSENTDFSLVNRLCNLLAGYEAAEKHYNREGTKGYQAFWSKYRRMFHNALTLAGILEIVREDVVRICDTLLPFLQVERHIHVYELTETLSYFVRNNADHLENRHFEAFFHYALNPESQDQDHLMHTLYHIIRARKLKIDITATMWENIQGIYLVNESTTNRKGSILDICMLFEMLADKTYRIDISNFLKYNLKQNFSGEDYYWATINQIVRPNKQLNRKYEAEIIEVAREGKKMRLFEYGHYHDDSIDQYLNFCFYFNIPLNGSLCSELSKLDEYYRWVTAMDAFDYAAFDPDWLFTHLTNPYKEQFKRSAGLRTWLRSHLFKSNDPRMGQLYVQLFTEAWP